MPIANNTVNAVAMTVLPDAPVDPVTGLKVPTIAVATVGGVSVIKHNGTVVNGPAANNNAVAIVGSTLFAKINQSGGPWYYSATPIGTLAANFPLTAVNNQFSAAWGGIKPAGQNVLTSVGSGNQINVMRHNGANTNRPVVASLTPTYNTGHQPGDIRRTYLSDNVVESVSGPELVTNGTFDTDTTGWTSVASGVLSVDTNRLLITNGNYGGALQYITVVPGRTYIIRGTYTAGTVTTGRIAVYYGNQNGTAVSKDVTTGPFFMVFVGQGSSCPLALTLLSVTAGQTGFYDNITVTEVVADRSYKAQGASITGTLTKSAVASAAELVAYSGFSAVNYLREPYSADLDFGTGEWSVGAWVNVPATLPAANFPVTTNELISGSASAYTGNGTVSTAGDTITATCTTNGVYGIKWASSNISNVGAYVTFEVVTNSASRQLEFYPNLASTTSVVVGTTTGSKTYTVYAPTATGGNANPAFVMFGGLVGESFSVRLVSILELSPALITDRAHSSGAKLRLGVNFGGRLTATAFDGTTTRTVTTTAAYNTATWAKAEACYTTDGTLAIRVNGVEVAATRGNPLLTLNNSNAVLTIGNSYAADAPFPGSIALLKLSATVPTPEQSVWMYEQEKQMFRDGAKVCLPDSGSIVDLTYDDATDKWIAISATNESEWSGLVRTSVTAVPAGSYSKAAAASGVQLLARSTTNPGVDITIPAYGLREELVKRAEAAARLNAQLATFDYVGGFTATTVTGNTAITSVAGLTYPTSYIGARVSGSGIPTNTTIVAVSGTTIYLSAAATASASNVQISFVDYALPVGYEAKAVSAAGALKQEGSTKDWTRLFDGFKETIRFGTAPAYNAWVQIQAARSAA